MRTIVNAKNLLLQFSVLHFFCASTLVMLCWLSAAVYLIPYFFPHRNLQTQVFGIALAFKKNQNHLGDFFESVFHHE